LALLGGLFGAAAAAADELPLVTDVDFQPLASQAQRVSEALRYAGAPLADSDQKALDAAIGETDPAKGVRDIQRVLDKYALSLVSINPESRVKVAAGPAKPELQEQGWRTFLVKVHNEAGVTAPLKAESPNAAPLYTRSTGTPDPFGKVEPKRALPAEKAVKPGDVSQRFLDIAMFDSEPVKNKLSGLKVDYRLIQLYSRDAGKREAVIGFNVGQGTQDIGFRNIVPILFDCLPSTEVVLGVLDHDGTPTMASFIFRDKAGRVYPSPARRLAPDFFFHPQVYRAHNESVQLPPGKYDVEYTRGPEYLVEHRTIDVPDSVSHKETFRLRRWIHPAKMGWYSGDHHVHAAGCAHYETPMEGVLPKDMMRHILGEDLNIGCVLSWGPCWYFQKQFFEGKVHEASTADYIMRYDVEVSGFPSSHCGHLCLLRLQEDDYTPPGGQPTKLIEEWPSWDLPVLKWGKEQGGVVGFSHSGWGLAPIIERGDPQKGVPQKVSQELPNYVIPPMDGIGANEYLVDVAHDACDFISSVDTPYIYELNIWYHTLNCGFRAKLSGETDFPCIYGDRVGLGRVYVKLDEKLDFDQWCEGIKQGRSYVGDGLSHLIDFTLNNRAIGTEEGEVRLAKPGSVRIRAKVAAYLPEAPSQDAQSIRSRPYDQKPYWHLERARIGESRRVPLEVVVNGQPVKDATREIVADGKLQEVEFDVPIERSSWIALRILPSSHTNPIFVLVGDKPIRASRRSAEWCLKSIDQCWEQKTRLIRDREKDEARQAYEQAKAIYSKILHETEVD
jgi:hypothetical protein